MTIYMILLHNMICGFISIYKNMFPCVKKKKSLFLYNCISVINLVLTLINITLLRGMFRYWGP